jgi:hypothetical protein
MFTYCKQTAIFYNIQLLQIDKLCWQPSLAAYTAVVDTINDKRTNFT